MEGVESVTLVELFCLKVVILFICGRCPKIIIYLLFTERDIYYSFIAALHFGYMRRMETLLLCFTQMLCRNQAIFMFVDLPNPRRCDSTCVE